jgi:hypothetical protein
VALDTVHASVRTKTNGQAPLFRGEIVKQEMNGNIETLIVDFTYDFGWHYGWVSGRFKKDTHTFRVYMLDHDATAGSCTTFMTMDSPEFVVYCGRRKGSNKNNAIKQKKVASAMASGSPMAFESPMAPGSLNLNLKSVPATTMAFPPKAFNFPIHPQFGGHLVSSHSHLPPANPIAMPFPPHNMLLPPVLAVPPTSTVGRKRPAPLDVGGLRFATLQEHSSFQTQTGFPPPSSLMPFSPYGNMATKRGRWQPPLLAATDDLVVPANPVSIPGELGCGDADMLELSDTTLLDLLENAFEPPVDIASMFSSGLDMEMAELSSSGIERDMHQQALFSSQKRGGAAPPSLTITPKVQDTAPVHMPTKQLETHTDGPASTKKSDDVCSEWMEMVPLVGQLHDRTPSAPSETGVFVGDEPMRRRFQQSMETYTVEATVLNVVNLPTHSQGGDHSRSGHEDSSSWWAYACKYVRKRRIQSAACVLLVIVMLVLVNRVRNRRHHVATDAMEKVLGDTDERNRGAIGTNYGEMQNFNGLSLQEKKNVFERELASGGWFPCDKYPAEFYENIQLLANPQTPTNPFGDGGSRHLQGQSKGNSGGGHHNGGVSHKGRAPPNMVKGPPLELFCEGKAYGQECDYNDIRLGAHIWGTCREGAFRDGSLFECGCVGELPPSKVDQSLPIDDSQQFHACHSIVERRGDTASYIVENDAGLVMGDSIGSQKVFGHSGSHIWLNWLEEVGVFGIAVAVVIFLFVRQNRSPATSPIFEGTAGAGRIEEGAVVAGWV